MTVSLSVSDELPIGTGRVLPSKEEIIFFGFELVMNVLLTPYAREERNPEPLLSGLFS